MKRIVQFIYVVPVIICLACLLLNSGLEDGSSPHDIWVTPSGSRNTSLYNGNLVNPVMTRTASFSMIEHKIIVNTLMPVCAASVSNSK